MPSHLVIACEVMKPELTWLAGRMLNPPEVHFLPQGLHDTPDSLRDAVQQAVDAAEQTRRVERLVLGYGLCGRGLTGVHSTTCTLVIPKVHDCIPLLLGTGQDAAENCSQGGATFWLSPGWLRFSQLAFIRNRKARYADYLTRFDEDAALYLMDMEAQWLANYTQACFIRWEALLGDEKESVERSARQVAEDTRLPYTEQPGNEAFLTELLEGGADLERFFHIPPAHTLDLNGNGQLAVTAVCAR